MQKEAYLFETLAQIQDPKKIEALLEDLCTKKELSNMAERRYAAKLLLEGKTYNQVMEQSTISSATLSRVSRCVQYGEGYSAILKENQSKWKGRVASNTPLFLHCIVWEAFRLPERSLVRCCLLYIIKNKM